MITVIVTIFIAVALVYLSLRKQSSPERVTPAEAVAPARIRDEARPEREATLWETPMSQKQLRQVRDYIRAELPRIELTDWAYYALTAITNSSPEFSKLLVADELDLEFIKKSERSGIYETAYMAMQVDVKGMRTLRQYFHMIFMYINAYKGPATQSKFYWYGRDRVIALLRSYRASQGRFTPSEVRVCNANGDQLTFNKEIGQDMVKWLKRRFEELQKRAEKTGKKVKLNQNYTSKLPFIEFDLDKIAEHGIFKYNGSLVNSLYIDVRAQLGLCEKCSYDGNWAMTTTQYDVEASYFGFEEGTAMVLKYRAAVDTMGDCVAVEFHGIPEDSWLVRWLKSYKLHLEGND